MQMIKKETNDVVKKKCKLCGKLFIPKRGWQEFCNPDEQREYWRRIQNDKAYLLKKIERLEKKLNI